YGDSHIAADILTGALRYRLQDCFGDAGPGFVLAGRPWSWYSRPGSVTRTSAGWHVRGLAQADLAPYGQYGLAGVSFTTDKAGEWITAASECELYEIYLLKQPGGGAIDIRLDGIGHLHRVSLASSKIEPAYVKVGAEVDGRHSIEIRTAGP